MYNLLLLSASAFYLQIAFMSFKWLSKTIAIISLNGINQFVFVMEKFCVYFVLATEDLRIT